jgi:hypothetical protein
MDPCSSLACFLSVRDPRQGADAVWAVWAVWAVGCGLRAVGCGLWAVGCGLWAVGCGLCGLYGLYAYGGFSIVVVDLHHLYTLPFCGHFV